MSDAAGRNTPPWAAGVAFPASGLIVVAAWRGGSPLDMDQTLTHELAHLALGAALGPRAPRWLHEGFAWQHSPEIGWDRTETLIGMAWFGSAIPLDQIDNSFPAEELERQRTVRLGQLAQQRANAQALASTIVANVLYGDQHPYGFPEIGSEASLKAMTRDRLRAFWQQNFVANNAALVVAGDITMAELRPLAQKAFNAWQRGTPARPTLTAPASPASKVVIVDRPGAPQTQLRVAMIGAARSAPDFRPAQVMNTALGGLFSSRINMNLREQHGYTYGAQSQFTFRKSAGPFQVASGVRTDVTGPAAAEMIKELKGMAAAPMPQNAQFLK